MNPTDFHTETYYRSAGRDNGGGAESGQRKSQQRKSRQRKSREGDLPASPDTRFEFTGGVNS